MSKGKSSPPNRGLRLASLGAGIAGSYLGYITQGMFLTRDKRRGKLAAANAAVGRRMADAMGDLRGPVMKLGQMLSLQAGVLPEEMLFELSRLQTRAPAMHPSLMRAQFRASMGEPPENLFREFEPEPFAAASLGQVHRAVTRDGTVVAVKIQYPGIREAIASDFRWLRSGSKPAQATRHLPVRIIDEIEAQIMAEADYHREADNLEFFRRGLAGFEYATVPRVYRALSSDRVLTMSFVEGEHLDALLARRPRPGVRNQLGEHLFELYYFQLLHLGAFQADPHWGNYLFREDGHIGLVDFGCVKRLDPMFLANLHATFLYDGEYEDERFRRLVEARHTRYGETLSPASRRAHVEMAAAFFRVVYPPGRQTDDTPFDFGDLKFMREYLRTSSALIRAKGLLPEYALLGRAEVGLYQTLHRLRAKVHTSRIVRRYIDRPG